jgi:hypothetical protein
MMNNYDQHLNLPTPSPLQLLYDVMTLNASCWIPRDIKDCADLAEYTDLDREEVKQALRTIWLPIFKFKSSLTFALESMRTSHPDEIESDFCTFYLEVLKDIEP